MAPVHESARIGRGDPRELAARFGLGAVQVFVFPAGPTHQMAVELSVQELHQQGLVEASVVVDPARHDAVDPRGDLREGQIGTTPQPPTTDGGGHRLARLLTDGRKETCLPFALLSARAAGPKRVTQEGELDPRMLDAGSPVLGAVHDSGLGRVQSQPEPPQPGRDHITDVLRLCLAVAVDDDIVAVPFEPDSLLGLMQPSIKGVVHEQVRQQWRDDSSNAVGNFCFEVPLSYRRVELPRRVSGTQ